MYFSGITSPDINNGLGFRSTLWVSGCDHFCKNCHNSKLSDPNYGRKFLEEDFNNLVNIINKPYIKGLTLSGGDPLFVNNRQDVLTLILRIKDILPAKDIWLYTGYYLHDLIKMNDPIINEILNNIDIIVDGPYIEAKRDLSIPFRGSTNQNIFKREVNKWELFYE